MKCIEVVVVPKGHAPLEIRKAWIGLRLPVAQPYGEATEGRTIGAGGYVVFIADALEILGLYNRKVTEWWRANTNWTRPGATFVFDRASSVLYTGLPSITAPLGEGNTKTVQDFINELVGIPRRPGIGAIRRLCWSQIANPLSEAEERVLEESALTRPIVLLLANLVASEYSFRVQGASSEESFEMALKEGHEKLQALYRLAIAHSIEVQEEEIDRPLSFVDIGIRAGMIERVEGGVRPTPRGEVAVRRILGEDDNLPF